MESCREGVSFPHLHLRKDGKYLCAETNGALTVNRDVASDWESFFAVSEKEIVNALSPIVVAYDPRYHLP